MLMVSQWSISGMLVVNQWFYNLNSLCSQALKLEFFIVGYEKSKLQHTIDIPLQNHRHTTNTPLAYSTYIDTSGMLMVHWWYVNGISMVC